MPADVNRRSYRSELRTQQAAATRSGVIEAARGCFTTKGYVATSVAEIAREAGVNPDTVYRSVGRKSQLLVAAIDSVLASSLEPVASEERDYVVAIRAAGTAHAKLATYAKALAGLMPDFASLWSALRNAAHTDEECAALHERIAERRAANMRILAAELRATGEVRDDLTDQDVADIVWTTNAPEYFDLVMARGWTAERYAEWLTDLWVRTLLAQPQVGRSSQTSVI